MNKLDMESLKYDKAVVILNFQDAQGWEGFSTRKGSKIWIMQTCDTEDPVPRR